MLFSWIHSRLQNIPDINQACNVSFPNYHSFYPAALKGSGVLSLPERVGGRADKPR